MNVHIIFIMDLAKKSERPLLFVYGLDVVKWTKIKNHTMVRQVYLLTELSTGQILTPPVGMYVREVTTLPFNFNFVILVVRKKPRK